MDCVTAMETIIYTGRCKIFLGPNPDVFFINVLERNKITTRRTARANNKRRREEFNRNLGFEHNNNDRSETIDFSRDCDGASVIYTLTNE